jgi:hypothetical protein
LRLLQSSQRFFVFKVFFVFERVWSWKRNAKGRARASKAQVSVELFLGMTFFLLVLYWLNYFVASVRDSNTGFVDEEKIVSASLAQIANSVCAENASVSYSLPCLYREGVNVSYTVFSNGAENRVWIIPEEEGLPFVSRNAACNFSGVSVKARCVSLPDGGRNAGSVCLNSSVEDGVNKVGVWTGGCVH